MRLIWKSNKSWLRGGKWDTPNSLTPCSTHPVQLAAAVLRSRQTSIYKETKIKSALIITTSEDPKLQAVVQCQPSLEVKGRISMLKDAKKYAMDMNENELSTKRWSQTFIWNNRRVSPHCLGAKQRENVAGQKDLGWDKSGDQRKRLAGEHCVPLSDETVELSECFNWSNKWRSAPTYRICALKEIYQQRASTRVQEAMIDYATEKKCRKCHGFAETGKHILPGCPELSERQYLYWHNDALKCVLIELLIAHQLSEKPPPMKQEASSFHGNKDVEITWNCSMATKGSKETKRWKRST